MKIEHITVENQLGLHARPASVIVKTASRFVSDIWLEKDGTQANAKSIMSVMMLAAANKSTITVKASGIDEKEAVAAIIDLFRQKFNEE